MTLSITILGCGSSAGVPRVAVGWGACDPNEPKNRRRRCSILVERGSGADRTVVLVDTGPDLREQLIDAGVKRLDGVLYTHDHADHCHGIDDLRPMAIVHRRRIDVWMDEPTSEVMRTRFGYCFDTPPGSEYPPILTEHRMRVGEPATVNGPGGPIRAVPILLPHGSTSALGLRFGSFAYCPDLNDIPPEAAKALAGLDLWIVDALRESPHPSHFSLADLLTWIERLKPKRAVLTNLHCDLDYAALSRKLPPNVVAAYDGMRLTVAD